MWSGFFFSFLLSERVGLLSAQTQNRLDQS
jgi:hypothetical protein